MTDSQRIRALTAEARRIRALATPTKGPAVTIWTVAFWLAATERAAKTAAQAAGTLLALDQLTSLVQIDWAGIGSATAVAAGLSYLMSVASSGIGGAGPSLATEAIPDARPVIEP